MDNHVYLFQRGDFHDAPRVVRIFSNWIKAIENIPPDFVKVDMPPYEHYAIRETFEWLSISKIKVE